MYSLPPLPWPADALAPVIGATTVTIHHGKHHASYVNGVNELRSDEIAVPLEQLIADAHQSRQTKLFNNAAQAWNHAFYWESMTPARAQPNEALRLALLDSFGSLDGFVDQFVASGAAQFGSGWVWLLARDSKLTIESSTDAEQPWLDGGGTPLSVCDVWEHAYYLDYQQDRAAYLQAWAEKLLNWRFAATQLEAAHAGRGEYLYPV